MKLVQTVISASNIDNLAFHLSTFPQIFHRKCEYFSSQVWFQDLDQAEAFTGSGMNERTKIPMTAAPRTRLRGESRLHHDAGMLEPGGAE
jgi:hypothetical protein